jgi:type IV pilus assembly protein PilO
MKGTTRILLILAAAGALTVGLIVIVALPLKRAADADRDVINERRGQLVSLQNVAVQITTIRDEIGRLQGALEFFEHRLPQQREVDVILREVWRIAEARSLVPRSVRTTAPETMAQYSSQPIALSLEGPFEGFYQFLLGLEQMPRLTKVRQIQISKMPAEEGIVQADILMDIFFEKQE